MGKGRVRMRDQFLKEPRSPYFRGNHNERVGRFIITPTGRWFHLGVTCKMIRSLPDLAEVDIGRQNGDYYSAGSLIKMEPCTECNPLTAKPVKVEPLGSTDTPCQGRDREWVKSFNNRSPWSLIPVQKECINDCKLLKKCYQIFLEELPLYGVLGGVTIQQYKEWGPNALNMVKELVNVEDQQESEPTTSPRPERRDRRTAGSGSNLERVVGRAVGTVRGEGG